jgi:hypothetical protein
MRRNSPLSRSTMGRGVCAAAARPSHDISWMPGTVSAMVGVSGISG